MARGLNKVLLIGTVERAPEMRYTPGGRAVTSFSVAVSRAWRAGDGTRHEDVEWFNVVAWGALAEICKALLVRQQQVYVEGRLQTRRWDDTQGRQHFRTEVVASEVLALDDARAPADDLVDDNTPYDDDDDDDFAF